MSSTQKRPEVEGGVAVSDLEMRVKDIETLLKGGKNENRWSLVEIQEIINRTDFTTDMKNLPLQHMAGQLEKFNERLELAEGNISILQGSHRSHTNYDPIEFANMHGYRIEDLKKLMSPTDSQPASKYVIPELFQSQAKMIRHAMRFANEMSYAIQRDQDGETTAMAQALVTGLVELAGLKLEVQ
jgi:hypothetical protein